jgi:hypothetical protein
VKHLPGKKVTFAEKIEYNDWDFFMYPFSRDEMLLLLQCQPAREMFNPRSPSVKAPGLDPA